RATRGGAPGPAPPPWGWPARAYATGQGVAEGCGRWQEAVVLQRQPLWAPLGLPRAGPDGWGADARPREAEPPTRATAPPQRRASQPRTWRPRRPRWGRRTRGVAQTAHRPAWVTGRLSPRSALGGSL